MSILKFFFTQLHEEDRASDQDPLSHPALDAMSLDELADLPLMPENLGRNAETRENELTSCA
ncbi:MAG: hypothetical protein KGI75_09730 [Rhizobiaceae bacterium]|nr:hypothetical protein [Rhizobiaceae bacterium]